MNLYNHIIVMFVLFCAVSVVLCESRYDTLEQQSLFESLKPYLQQFNISGETQSLLFSIVGQYHEQIKNIIDQNEEIQHWETLLDQVNEMKETEDWKMDGIETGINFYDEEEVELDRDLNEQN